VSVTTAEQQEIDFLRAQVGTLGTIGLWTSKNPPKFTGAFGTMLQGLEGGESLIRAFVRLHEASEANRTNAKAILTLVQQYKVKVTAPRKTNQTGKVNAG
jgi:hypothetical protein